MTENELFGNSEQLESGHEKDHVVDPCKMVGDLIGKKYGMLTVMESAGYHITPCGTRRRLWKCHCDCGTEKIVQEPNLKNGTTKSCGCWKYRKIKEHNTKHGGSKDRLYGIWKGMKRRCNDSRDSHYATYGGKGIKICDEWANDYAVFKEWAYKNGYDENAKTGDCSIDRINNNGNYEPNNCRWVNRIQQANNTSQNRYVTLNGKRLTIAEFARTMNISQFKARYRIELFEKGDTNEQFDRASGGD